MITKSHHFYGLWPSPWPLVMALNTFNMLFSMLMFLKFNHWDLLIYSLMLSAASSFYWWMKYSSEMTLEGSDSSDMMESIKTGMILFISSEVFFFFSFFWSYFHYFLSPCMETSMLWPPFYVEPFSFLNVPLLNTVILMFSGATITLAHYFLMEDMLKMGKLFLSLTWVLGIIFTLFQAQEYKSSFFSLADATFGTSFFMLTGFHGIHVLIGTIFLITVFFSMSNLTNFKFESVSFELASWYWHFVDVVWIFLYFLLYYLNN